MTLEEIETLADEGYKTIIPQTHNCDFCVLGAAVLAKTGKKYGSHGQVFADLLGLDQNTSMSIQYGFDDTPSDWLEDRLDQEAFNFGQRMRAKYIGLCPV